MPTGRAAGLAHQQNKDGMPSLKTNSTKSPFNSSRLLLGRISWRFPYQLRRGPCSSHILDKRRASEQRCCTEDRSLFDEVSSHGANVVCLFVNWSGVVLEQP